MDVCYFFNMVFNRLVSAYEDKIKSKIGVLESKLYKKVIIITIYMHLGAIQISRDTF